MWSKEEIIDKIKLAFFIGFFVVGPVALIVYLDDGSPRSGDRYDYIRR